LKDTGAENRVISLGISTPDVGTEEDRESADENGSLSENQGQWHPEKVAQSKSEDIVVGQEGDLINRDSENFGVGEEENRETR
jgi:hypothetical protein